LLWENSNKPPSLFEQAAKNYKQVREEALQCTRCHLREGCQQVVFGVGKPSSSLMLVGEGPGAREDELGEPFVGRAGQLLTRILEAINLKREEVYISNIVKCRPPSNRQPSPPEMEICMPWLREEFRLIQPRVLVLLGATAYKGLIDPGGKITRDRGQWIEKNELLIMPTFHPAALLRDPRKKIPVWEDFQEIEKVLNSKN